MRARVPQCLRQEAAGHERRELAGRIHDEVLQGIYAALLATAGEPDGPGVTRLRDALVEAARQLRAICDGLHEAVAGCLGDELRRLAARFGGQRGGPLVELQLDGQLPALPPAVVEAMLAIASNALANALRHSGATTITLSARAAGARLLLEVRDDGRGFLPPAPAALLRRRRYGLLAMRERAARIGALLRLESAPGQGTLVQVEWELVRGEQAWPAQAAGHTRARRRGSPRR